jgi:hypothetical protein
MLTTNRSTVIETLLEQSEANGIFVAHFFYSHSTKFRLEASHLFRSYIKQILAYLFSVEKECPSPIIICIRRFYDPNRLPPTLQEITEYILVPLFEQIPKAICVIDGLDECEQDEVRAVLRTFQDLLSHRVKIFISGRESLEVKNALKDSLILRIADEDVREDIRLFIEHKIDVKLTDKQLTENKAVLERIKTALNQGADRMSVKPFSY